MRPEYAPRQPGKPQTLVADHIYITVPLTRAGVPDRAAHDAIEKEFARVAEFHHLQRVARTGSTGPGAFRLPGGRTAHAIDSSHDADWSCVSGFTRFASLDVPAPRLAIVIDDLGSDRAQADALFRLSYPLTLSVLPHLSSSGEIAEEAHRRGYQVMLHLPMASTAGKKTSRSSCIPAWIRIRWGKHSRPC